MRSWAFVIKVLLHSHWEDSENDNKNDLICAFQRSLRLLYGERPGDHRAGEEGQVEAAEVIQERAAVVNSVCGGPDATHFQLCRP